MPYYFYAHGCKFVIINMTENRQRGIYNMASLHCIGRGMCILRGSISVNPKPSPADTAPHKLHTRSGHCTALQSTVYSSCLLLVYI